MSRDQKLALGCLGLVYPLFCLILFSLKVGTPDKQEMFGGEVDMFLQKGLANVLYNNLVSVPFVVICILISGVIFYYATKERY